MSDPIEDLENFDTEGLNVNPLPASEVRRRGNRIRRRNNALAAIGGIAAVAIIAAPLALGATGGDRADDVPPVGSPSPSPSTGQTAGAEWVQRIPDGFPLNEGMPATNGHDGSPVTARPGYEAQAPVSPCGSQTWTPEAPVPATDVAQAIHTDASEGAQERVLALYDDDVAAGKALGAIQTALSGECPAPRNGPGSEALASDLGEESVAYVDRYRDRGELTGEATLFQVVRTGNALLLETSYFRGAGDDRVVASMVDLMGERSAGVISDLCLFAAEPCGPADGDPGEGSGSGGPSGSGDLADRVDLTVGYPETNGDDGSAVSTEADPGVTTLAFCGDAAWDPVQAVEVAGATYNGEAEDSRGRTLALYDDAEQAADALASLRAGVEACPVETDGSSERVHETVAIEAGDESFAFTQRYRTEGRFDTGLTVYQAVRVGRALYVALAYGEGGGSAGTIESSITRLGTDSQGVVDQLCTLTDEDC